jgi:hypothetical protein
MNVFLLMHWLGGGDDCLSIYATRELAERDRRRMLDTHPTSWLDQELYVCEEHVITDETESYLTRR